MTEGKIVKAVAVQASARIIRSAIARLQKMTFGSQSGDDSGLKDTWDEICVQVQFERSVMWDAYDETVESLLMTLVDALPDHERSAIWLQSEEGIDWVYDKEDGDPMPEFDSTSIVAYLKEELYGKASDWTNSRIRTYIDGSDEYY